MPTYMTPQVVLQTLFAQFIRLRLAIDVHLVNNQTFHGRGLAVLRMSFENLLACFQALLVLLRLVVPLWRRHVSGVLQNKARGRLAFCSPGLGGTLLVPFG